MGHEPQSLPLVLDTYVDGAVEFAALSVLPSKTVNGSSKTEGGSAPRVPPAGSIGWLSSMAEVGRQEVSAHELDSRYADETQPIQRVLHRRATDNDVLAARPTQSRTGHNRGDFALQVCPSCGHFVDFECSRENALALTPVWLPSPEDGRGPPTVP